MDLLSSQPIVSFGLVDTAVDGGDEPRRGDGTTSDRRRRLHRIGRLAANPSSRDSRALDRAREALRLRETLGGKAASLIAMLASGFRVPPGFVIPIAWQDAWSPRNGTGDRDATGDGGDLVVAMRAAVQDALATLSTSLGRSLEDPERPLVLAVRSGASESLPGLLETVLDVRTPGELFAAIERVHRSWEEERVAEYCRERGLIGLRGTAVIVQAQCAPEVAGVAFTSDPGRAGSRDIIIECVPGLGESLVSGEREPERVRLRRADLATIEQRLPPGESATALPGDRAARIARAALEIERLFKEPVDVEWAWDTEGLVLLQARATRAARLERARERSLLGESGPLARNGKALWVRHNLDETLSRPTPASWGLHRALFRGSGAVLELYRELGYRPSARVVETGFLARIGGRIFAEAGRAAEVWFGADSLRHEESELRENPARLESAPRPLARSDIGVLALLRSTRIAARVNRKRQADRTPGALHPADELLARFQNQERPAFLAACEAEAGISPAELDTDALVDALRRTFELSFGRFARSSFRLVFEAAAAFEELVETLEQLVGEPSEPLARELVTALDDDISFELHLALARLRDDPGRRDEFLRRFGHRGPREMELAAPRFAERLESLEHTARAMPDTATILARARTAREAAVVRREELLRDVRERADVTAARALDEQIARARRLLPVRELWKHEFLRGLARLRALHVEAGRRLEIGEQVFWLEPAELASSLRDGEVSLDFRTRVRERREEALACRTLELPSVLTHTELLAIAARTSNDATAGDDADLSYAAATGETERSATLAVFPLASGRATGRVVIAREPEDLAEHALETPYVLVCPSTDCGWTSHLARASALVVERGGALSHGAILCRDLGLPAVSLPDALSALRDGEAVHVDADRALVERVNPDSQVEDRPRAERGEPLSLHGPAPWLGSPRPHLLRDAALSVVVALGGSLALLLMTPLRSRAEFVSSLLLDGLLVFQLSTFWTIASVALVSALAATLLGLAVLPRRRLRALANERAWYRKTRRALERRQRVTPLPSSRVTRTREALARRARGASIRRGLEISRTVAVGFLPFALGFLWMDARFESEPIQPRSRFRVMAYLDNESGPGLVRHARLDIEPRDAVRIEEDRYRPIEVEHENPARGPYSLRWSVLALREEDLVVSVSAGATRLEATARVTLEPDPPRDRVSGRGPLRSLSIVTRPVRVELPTLLAWPSARLASWISGRDVPGSAIAVQPLTVYLVVAILAAWLMRCALEIDRSRSALVADSRSAPRGEAG